jgi:alkaline phosphatase
LFPAGADRSTPRLVPVCFEQFPETAVTIRPRLLLRTLVLAVVASSPAFAADVPSDASDHLKALQTGNVATAREPRERAYHFGSQGNGGPFSNHTSHSNRLIPIYTFGKKVDLGRVTGKNSIYRDASRLKTLYGFLPENTVNPEAEYADQSDLYHVQRDAVAKGVKYLFIVWFDGMDWPATQAAAIAKTGKVYTSGKGSGLVFQDYDAGGSAQYGYCVTAPTHEPVDARDLNVDAQTAQIPLERPHGGYDAMIAGPNPWTLGPLGPQAPGYLKGQSGNA